MGIHEGGIPSEETMKDRSNGMAEILFRRAERSRAEKEVHNVANKHAQRIAHLYNSQSSNLVDSRCGIRRYGPEMQGPFDLVRRPSSHKTLAYVYACKL